jgi:hypothetical protein
MSKNACYLIYTKLNNKQINDIIKTFTSNKNFQIISDSRKKLLVEKP